MHMRDSDSWREREPLVDEALPARRQGSRSAHELEPTGYAAVFAQPRTVSHNLAMPLARSRTIWHDLASSRGAHEPTGYASVLTGSTSMATTGLASSTWLGPGVRG